MSPNNWGPPIWMLFHSLAEKIKEENKLAEEIQAVFLGDLNDKFDVFCSKLSVFLKEKNISLEKSTFFNVAKIIRINLKNK